MVTGDEVALASAINAVFYDALPSDRTRDRDWKILREIASNTGSERQIARKLGVGKGVVSDAKSKKGRAAMIWKGVQYLIPEPTVAGKVWRDAS